MARCPEGRRWRAGLLTDCGLHGAMMAHALIQQWSCTLSLSLQTIEEQV